MMPPDQGRASGSTQGAASAPNELTLRAMLLGVILSAVLAAANAYLGLFAGMTVSAAIPAAVVSMGLMRAVRASILENNLVQTAASAGEAAAAGAIFTLPALLLLGAWTSFPWLDCCLLVLSGGVLGVVFTTFLRRPLIVDDPLPFPEGVATAQVLVAGHARMADSTANAVEAGPADRRLLALLWGGVLGAVFKFLEAGLGICRAAVEGAVRVAGGVMYAGSSTSPALLAVGYIVGFRIALVVCAGGLINWLLVVPWVAVAGGTGEPLDWAWAAWSGKTRYLGVGAMTFCGLSTLVMLRATIARAVRDGLSLGAKSARPTTDRSDIPVKFIFLAAGLTSVLLTWMFARFLPSLLSSVLVTAATIVMSFLFCAVAAHMAGLLGSSNNPVSGVTIATIIFVSLLLLAVGVQPQVGAMATIFVGSVVCTAAAIGGDNMQDLKAGHLLGASPVRQQVMQLLGVVAAALVLGPVLQLLSDSYGFGPPSALHPRPLMAPQATLMTQVARGMFGGELPWNMIGAGMGLGALFTAFDVWLARAKRGFRAPPLALSLGLYLPVELSVPVLLGGMASRLAERGRAHSAAEQPASVDSGVLLSAGLITGEALMGVLLAGLVLAWGGLADLRLGWESASLSVVSVLGLCWLLVRSGRKA